MIREHKEHRIALSREFLHSFVELVIFEFVLGVPDVLLGHSFGIVGLHEFAGLTEQLDRLAG